METEQVHMGETDSPNTQFQKEYKRVYVCIF